MKTMNPIARLKQKIGMFEMQTGHRPVLIMMGESAHRKFAKAMADMSRDSFGLSVLEFDGIPVSLSLLGCTDPSKTYFVVEG